MQAFFKTQDRVDCLGFVGGIGDYDTTVTMGVEVAQEYEKICDEFVFP